MMLGATNANGGSSSGGIKGSSGGAIGNMAGASILGGGGGSAVEKQFLGGSEAKLGSLSDKLGALDVMGASLTSDQLDKNQSSSGNIPSSQKTAIPSHLYKLVRDLIDTEKRDFSLLELSKKREDFPDLAPILWHSFGTIAALLQEIVSIYPLLSPPRLTTELSNRCCNALALLQCVASHPETRSAFLSAHIPLYLYPFLNTVCEYKQYEYLRLTSLGVIGALVKMDDSDVIKFLLQTQIIPLCLRIMDNGSGLSKTVATFIIQKILLDDQGLDYICLTFERFSTVSDVLRKMVLGLKKQPSVRLLKHICRCYLRLSENKHAREALQTCIPNELRDHTFAEFLKDDSERLTRKWLQQLRRNIGDIQDNNNMLK